MSAVTSLASRARGFELENVYIGPTSGSLGAGDVARNISEAFKEIHERLNDNKARIISVPDSIESKTVKEQLFNALVNAKVLTAQVSMHLDKDWRNDLFARLDELLDADDWHEDDQPMEKSSFVTFLRMMLHLRPDRIPSLGVSNQGHLIAAWLSGKDRLVLEFLSQDIILWTLSCEVDGELERAAGETPVRRLLAVINPYSPDRWFEDASNTAAAG